MLADFLSIYMLEQNMTIHTSLQSSSYSDFARPVGACCPHHTDPEKARQEKDARNLFAPGHTNKQDSHTLKHDLHGDTEIMQLQYK